MFVVRILNLYALMAGWKVAAEVMILHACFCNHVVRFNCRNVTLRRMWCVLVLTMVKSYTKLHC